MDHSAFPDEYWEFFNPLDDDDAVTMDSAQHARAAAAVCLAVGTAIDADGPGPHGSIAGRKANMNREFDVGLQRMLTDYCNETPTYDDKMFARRFRMPRAVFDRIYKDVSARAEFVQVRRSWEAWSTSPAARGGSLAQAFVWRRVQCRR
jgi:hypothetical protein